MAVASVLEKTAIESRTVFYLEVCLQCQVSPVCWIEKNTLTIKFRYFY